MPPSEKRTSTQREQKVTPSRAGGPAGDAMRDRLRALIAKRGESQAAFARACGVEPPRISEWLAGSQLPSADHLRAVSERTGASLDWLLLGDGGDAPVMRGYHGERRTDEELEADVAAHIRREIAAAQRARTIPHLPSPFARRLRAQTGLPVVGVGASLEWVVDGRTALAGAVAREVEAARQVATATDRGAEAAALARGLRQAKNQPDPRQVEAVAAFLEARADEHLTAAWTGQASALPIVAPPVGEVPTLAGP